MRIVAHHSELVMPWQWSYFAAVEIACRHCGFVHVEDDLLDGLQNLRRTLGAPVRLNSVYRCPVHNALVGGAPMSRHKLGQAADVAVGRHPRDRLDAAARDAGFGGLGYYQTFLHVDIGPKRTWGRWWT